MLHAALSAALRPGPRTRAADPGLLVVGATGRLGAALLDALLARQRFHPVRVAVHAGMSAVPRGLAPWIVDDPGDAPDPITPEDVKWLYPCDQGTSVDADGELLALCTTLKGAKAKAKEVEADIELMVTKIKVRMGAAASLLGPNGKPIATWKTNKDVQKTDWQAVAKAAGATPEQIADHTKTTPGDRPFLLK